MAKLNTLPIEILNQIWTLVDFKDIESFSLTCRIVRNAGVARIAEHLGRKKRYSVLHIPMKSEARQQGHHRISSRNRDDFLVGVLCQIFEEPILAKYVEHLVVDRLLIAFSQECYQDEFLDARQSKYELTENKLSILPAIIDTCPYLVDVQKDIRANNSNEWIRNIEAGGEVALLGLLLYLLCHVQMLRLESTTIDSTRLIFHMMSRIGHDAKASALCKLRRLEIGLLGTRLLEEVARAAVLPSLKSIKLGRLINTWDFHVETSTQFTPDSSNVKELILEDCQNVSLFPEDFLSIFRALETFILVPDDSPCNLDPHRIIAGLLRNAQNSLKHLVLHARFRKPTWMGSLCNLKSLISIHTDWWLLIDESSPTSKGQLAETLPSSIEALNLKVDSTFNTNKTNLDMISHLLVHIETEAASTVLQQPFVREAKSHGFIITCDTSIDTEGARMAEYGAEKKGLFLTGRLAALQHWI